MTFLAINSAGEDENSDDEGSADKEAEVRDLVRDVAQRDDVPQDLRQRAQAITGQ
ncbi:hypothetical protein ACFRAR_15965 [Kitasatospora sp. NPDC056651]|uniref:hypothetical protein n=1 Tax=Kitasatospora sp. NPDC056651 TaxID=3345892 RepID=UPI0036D1F343